MTSNYEQLESYFSLSRWERIGVRVRLSPNEQTIAANVAEILGV